VRAESSFPITEDAAGHRFHLVPIDCPTCGPTSINEIGLRGGQYHRYGLGITSTIFSCQTCSLLFPKPLPVPIDPQSLYNDPASYFARHPEAARILEYRGLIREAMAKTTQPQPSLLDVGSGRGDLLRAARLEGLTDTVGLEFATAMVDHARTHHGLELVQMTLEDYASSRPRMFDIVILNAIIEHVYDPNEFISQAAQLLSPGGVLYIDTPNDPNLLTRVGNIHNRLLGRKGIYNLSPTWPPYHLFGFNRRAIRTLLGKHGFAIESVKIHNDPHIPSRGGTMDRVRSTVGTQILRLANMTGSGSNMFVWARRV
jgi:SAM-dependent methyltransferase